MSRKSLAYLSTMAKRPRTPPLMFLDTGPYSSPPAMTTVETVNGPSRSAIQVNVSVALLASATKTDLGSRNANTASSLS